MSTYPLVQVEGALAMPHMRPLNRVPPPFGREWALIPPHFSLRTELHALYAALLRTACLSAEAFRKVCRWETGLRTRSETHRPAAAPVGATLNVAQAQQAAAAALQRKTAGASPAAAASPLAPLAPLERTPPRNHKLTATAVGIGGAAVLAWIVASHTQPGDSRSASKASADSPASVPTNAATHAPANAPVNHGASASQRLAEARAEHELSYSGSVTASAPTVAAPVKSSAPNTADKTVAASAIVVAQQPNTAIAPSKATSASSVAPAPLVAARPAEPMRPSRAASVRVERHDYAAKANPNTPLRATLTRKAEPASRASSTNKARHAPVESRTRSARGDTGRHIAHEFAPLRSEPLATTRRAHGAYSTAEAYSPRQPSVEAANDYTSITTYAVTHAAPASRASAPVDNTEWVNHVSQRRVTEVPERFSK
jgi:hypothetical protein